MYLLNINCGLFILLASRDTVVNWTDMVPATQKTFVKWLCDYLRDRIVEMYVMFHEFYSFCQRCMSSFIPFADRYFIAMFREIPQEHLRDKGISEGTMNKLNTCPVKVILLKNLCKRSMDSLLGLVDCPGQNIRWCHWQKLPGENLAPCGVPVGMAGIDAIGFTMNIWEPAEGTDFPCV